MKKEIARWTPQQKAESLKILAESKTLRDAQEKIELLHGQSPSHESLRRWRQQMPEAWARAQELVISDRRVRIRTKRVELMESTLGVGALIVDQMHEALTNGEVEVRDLPAYVKAISVAHGIMSDKMAAAAGEPTHVVEHRNSVAESLRSLEARFGVNYDVEGDADEDT